MARTPENDSGYLTLSDIIRDQGVFEEWRGRRYKYRYAGDGCKYWTIGPHTINPPGATNRPRFVDGSGGDGL